jgi:hypothetical protein
MFDRFMHKIDASWGVTGGCWEWRGRCNGKGYGNFWLNGKTRRAHRVSYGMFTGPIPAGLDLDHLCRNRSCVNPAHLEPVTALENTRRGLAGATARARQLAKTHCKHGHAFSNDNTRLRVNGARACRECDAKSSRERRARNKEKHVAA